LYVRDTTVSGACGVPALSSTPYCTLRPEQTEVAWTVTDRDVKLDGVPLPLTRGWAGETLMLYTVHVPGLDEPVVDADTTFEGCDVKLPDTATMSK